MAIGIALNTQVKGANDLLGSFLRTLIPNKGIVKQIAYICAVFAY